MKAQQQSPSTAILTLVLLLLAPNLHTSQLSNKKYSLEVLHSFQLENYSYLNFSSDVWNNQMIIFGGCTQDLHCTSDLIFYDLINNSKKVFNKKFFADKELDSPPDRQGHASVVIMDSLLVFGGSNESGLLSDTWLFNLRAQKWVKLTLKGEKLISRTNHRAIGLSGNRVALFGGFASFQTNSGQEPEASSSMDNFSALDLLNSLVTERQELTNSLQILNLDELRVYTLMTRGTPPRAREDFGLEVFGNRLFIFGGYVEGGVASDLHMLDLDSLRWSEIQGTSQIQGRQGVDLVYLDKKLFFVGGVDKSQGRTINDGWFYDLEEMLFSRLPLEGGLLLGKSSLVLFRNDLYLMNRCNVDGDCQFNLAVLEMGIDCPSGCSGRGECNSGGVCNCSLGFEGNDCQRENPCESECKNHEFCLSNGKCSSTCLNGNCGDNKLKTVHCPDNCGGLSRGICLDNGKCLCNPGIGGQNCSVDVEDKELESVIGVDDDMMQSIKGKNKVNPADSGTPGIDLPENYQKISFEMFGFKYFKQRSAMGSQKNLDKYDSLRNCPDECNSRGFCKDNECYCRPGYVGTSCEVSTESLETTNQEFFNFQKRVIIYCFVALLLGAQFGIFTYKYIKSK